MPASSSEKRFHAWWLAIPLLTAGSQACIKLLSIQLKGQSFGLSWIVHAFTNPYALGILFCEVVGFMLWLRILSTVSISRALPLTAFSYFAIMAMSWFYFHEPFFMLQIVGSILIVSGIVLIAAESA